MKKSTLMLNAGAAIAFFAYRYFIKSKAQKTDSIQPGDGFTSVLNPDSSFAPDPNITSAEPPVQLPLTPELPTLGISKIGLLSKDTFFTYTGPNVVTSNGYILSSGEKILVMVEAGTERLIIQAIQGDPKYLAGSVKISSSYVTI